MARTLTDEQLAQKLEQQEVDRVILDEAARRIRACELQELLQKNAIVEAIHESPLLDKHKSEIAERIILAVRAPKRSSSRLSSLAARVLQGGEYTEADVRSLAASVLSQDETPGQS